MIVSEIKRRLEEKLILQDSFRHCFDGPDGEKVLSYLMKVCGLLNPKIITDPNLLLVRQGQQHIVLSILRIIGKDPKSIVEQIKESMQNEDK